MKLIVDGRTYRELPSCVTGDYVGDGDVGEANQRTLMKEFDGRWEYWFIARFEDDADGVLHPREGSGVSAQADMIIVGYAFNSKSVFLAEDTDEFDDIFGALENYPLLDDSEHSEVENEWLLEAFQDWIHSDLIREIRRITDDDTLSEEEADKLDEEIERIDDLPLDVAYEIFHQACREVGEYPTFDYNSAHINVEKVARHYLQKARDHLALVP